MIRHVRVKCCSVYKPHPEDMEEEPMLPPEELDMPIHSKLAWEALYRITHVATHLLHIEDRG